MFCNLIAFGKSRSNFVYHPQLALSVLWAWKSARINKAMRHRGYRSSFFTQAAVNDFT